MSVFVYKININGTSSPIDGEHECNGAGLNWDECFHAWTTADGFPVSLSVKFPEHSPIKLDMPKELSDDFIYFCQHGKYPAPKIDHELEALKKRNQQVNERKGFLAEEILSSKYYDGFSYNKSITIQALLELAIELSPDTDTFCETCDDVVERFCDDPHSVIDNLPR